MPERNAFSAAGIDRASTRRTDPTWLAERLRDPSSLCAPVWRSHNLVRGGERPEAALLQLDRLEKHLEGSQPIFLGIEEGKALFCAEISQPEDGETPLEPGTEFADLRQVAGLLSERDGALLAYARGMATWHREGRYCGRCGSANRPTQAGHVFECSNPECARQSFPRTDPAVIMLVTDGDRALLGRQASWPPGVFSTLAGFCEPGESLEDAVAREVLEEAGVTIEEAHYHSSQPWPFPSSLMLGFMATARGGEPKIRDGELEAARWFGREELLELKARREVNLPPRLSIARRLIDSWLFG